MSYGMHDYLTEKAMQSRYGMRKEAGKFSFFSKLPSLLKKGLIETKKDLWDRQANALYRELYDYSKQRGNKSILGAAADKTRKFIIDHPDATSATILAAEAAPIVAASTLIPAVDYNVTKLEEEQKKADASVKAAADAEKRLEAYRKAPDKSRRGGGTYGQQPSLRDRILEQVLSNKYALGGAGAFGAAGATVGALASNENRLRNALIGGGIGTILGGVAGHIADRYV